jgi:diguanylate cyclase (GGDEF)-like protein/PAS domain S-box-containing protein
MNEKLIRVCLIDDRTGDSRLLTGLLDKCSRRKFQVDHYHSLSDGIENLSSRDFEVLLLDLFLPDSGGLDTFYTIQQHEFDIPVIILIGIEDENLALKALQTGAQDYLVKGDFDHKLICRAIDYSIERHRLHQCLKQISTTDDLSGLHNRLGFVTLAEQQIKSANRTNTKLLVIYIDIDGLKQINDQHGHRVGDRSLVAVAELLSNTFRTSDIIGRIGCDEFAVMAVSSQGENRDTIIQRLDAKRKRFVDNIGGDYDLSLSVGVAEWNADQPKSLDTLLLEAEESMCAQKKEQKCARHKSGEIEDSHILGLGLEEKISHSDTLFDEINIRVLLIEDNLADARLVQELLSDYYLDFQIIHAQRLSEAKSLLNEAPFDVILLDLSLPDSHGLQSLDEIMKHAPDTPVVVMTGTDDHELAMLALKKGAQDYLAKGKYDENLLGRSVQYAIERHRLRMQNTQFASDLHHSEVRFSRLIEENADGIIVVDDDRVIKYANMAMAKLTGRPVSDLVGEVIDFPLELDTKTEIEIATDFVSTIAELHTVDTSWLGEPGYLVTVRDITDRVRAQDAMKRHADDLSLINSINDALNRGADLESVVATLKDGTRRALSGDNTSIYLLSADKAFLNQIGKPVPEDISTKIEALIGGKIPDIQIPILSDSCAETYLNASDPFLVDDKAEIERWANEFLAIPSLPKALLKAIRKLMPKILDLLDIQAMIVAPLVSDGEPIGLLEVSTRTHFARNDVWRVATIAKQITTAIRRKLSEEQMRLQAAALDAAANAIMIADREGKMIWANPSFLSLTGFELDEIIGQNPRLLKSGQHEQSYYQQLWQTILDGHVWFGEVINRRKNGELYHEEMTIAPVPDENGQISHFIAVKQDVSSRKLNEITLQRQLDELAILHSVAVVGVEEVDEDQLIERVTDIIAGTLYPEHFGVLLLDDSEQVLINHSSFRGIPDGFRTRKIALGDGIVGSVALTGLNRRVPDVSQVPEYITALPGLQSALSVPLKVGDQILGVLHSESNELDAFSDEDERLLSTIAGQLATAIERIRQQTAEKEQRIRAETLSDSALALTSSLSIDELLDQILLNIERMVPFEAASLMLNENGHTRLIRQIGFENRNAEKFVSDLILDFTEYKTLQEMNDTGQPIIVPDVSRDERWINAAQTEGVRSYLGAPIRKDDTTLGFLNLDHSQVDFFNENHAKGLLALAHQLAIALENARLYEETEVRATELSRLYNASGILLASTPLDIRKLGLTIVDTVRTEFGQSNCSLLLTNEENQQLERIAVSGPYADEVADSQALWLDGPGLVPSAVRERKIINVPDVTQREDYVSNWNDARSEMAIPLLVGEKAIGAIDVQSVKVNAFNADDERIVSVFAERAALSLENTRLYQRQQRQLAFLESLRQIDLAITGSMNLDVMLNVIVRQVKAQLGVDALAILVLDKHTLLLEPIAQNGFSISRSPMKAIRFGEGLGGQVAQQAKLVQYPCLSDDEPEFVRSNLFQQEGFQSYYGLPLKAKGLVKGVLELFHRASFEPDAQWISFAETVATQTAIAIDSAQLFQDLEHSNLELSMAYDTTLEGWAKALELRDHETEGHARRVVEMTLNLAKIMGFSGAELVHLRRGALLHDIGKMGVPDQILQKDGPLDDDEWEIMRQHPIYAYNWLRSIRYLRPALDIPHYHHEKWDGSGYPEGLKGEQIPISARMFAIIDVWDALRSDRPYRKAWTKDKTLALINDEKGHHFDPQVVDAFLEMISQNS